MTTYFLYESAGLPKDKEELTKEMQMRVNKQTKKRGKKELLPLSFMYFYVNQKRVNVVSFWVSFSAEEMRIFCFVILTAGAVVAFDPDYTYINRLNHFMEASFNTVLSLTAAPEHPIEEDVTFWCANRANPNYTQTFVNDTELWKKLEKKLPIAFITHGWFDNANRTWIKQTISGTNYCWITFYY